MRTGGSDYSVIYVAQTRFDGPAQPDSQLGRAMARERPVLYVEPPTFVHDAVRRRDWRSIRPRVRTDGGVQVFRPIASPGADRPGLARLGDRVIERQIRRAAEQALADRPRVVICADVRRGPVTSVPRRALVYTQQDRVPSDPSLPNPDHLRARHNELLARADLVTSIAQVLVDEAAPRSKRVMLLPNGAEYERFAPPVPPPPELPSDGVVIGFAGGVTERINYELLTVIADAHPEWTVALVGPVTVAVPVRRNLIVAGNRDYAAMPSWCQRFTVGLIPYWTNDYNDASFPLKTYEYLAAGRPVVSTPLPMLEPLAPFVRFGSEPVSFLRAVELAVAEGPDTARCQEIAKSNSWNERARQLHEAISTILAGADPALTPSGG